MTRAGNILPRVAIFLVALGSLAYSAVPVARHSAGVVVTEAPPPLDLPEMARAQPIDLSPVFERAPFGRPAAPADVANSDDAPLPQLTLRGVFASSGSAAVALIDVDSTPGLFRRDDQVTPTLALVLIAADHVVLRDGETTVTLRFDELEEAPQVAEADAQPKATPQDLLSRLGRGLVVPAGYEKPKPPETTAEYIDYWRNRIRKNPKAVLDEIGLKPTDAGYVIADRHDVGVKLAGLKTGDLVRSVNGRAVGDPNSDSRFYDRIAAAGQARLEVERGGRILTFSFPLR